MVVLEGKSSLAWWGRRKPGGGVVTRGVCCAKEEGGGGWGVLLKSTAKICEGSGCWGVGGGADAASCERAAGGMNKQHKRKPQPNDDAVVLRAVCVDVCCRRQVPRCALRSNRALAPVRWRAPHDPCLAACHCSWRPPPSNKGKEEGGKEW